MVARPEIIQARFRVSFFAGELVVLRDGIGDDHLAAIRVVIGLVFDRAAGVGHDARRAQVVGEIVVHGIRGHVPPRHPLGTEEDILFLIRSRQVAFGNRFGAGSRPVKCSRRTVPFLHPNVIAIVDVRPPGSCREAIVAIIGVRRGTVLDHVSSHIIAEADKLVLQVRGGTEWLVVGLSRNRRALPHAAPRVGREGLAPVAAVAPGLREAVQGVVGEVLCTIRVATPLTIW